MFLDLLSAKDIDLEDPDNATLETLNNICTATLHDHQLSSSHNLKRDSCPEEEEDQLEWFSAFIKFCEECLHDEIPLSASSSQSPCPIPWLKTFVTKPCSHLFQHFNLLLLFSLSPIDSLQFFLSSLYDFSHTHPFNLGKSSFKVHYKTEISGDEIIKVSDLDIIELVVVPAPLFISSFEELSTVERLNLVPEKSLQISSLNNSVKVLRVEFGGRDLECNITSSNYNLQEFYCSGFESTESVSGINNLLNLQLLELTSVKLHQPDICQLSSLSVLRLISVDLPANLNFSQNHHLQNLVLFNVKSDVTIYFGNKSQLKSLDINSSNDVIIEDHSLPQLTTLKTNRTSVFKTLMPSLSVLTLYYFSEELFDEVPLIESLHSLVLVNQTGENLNVSKFPNSKYLELHESVPSFSECFPFSELALVRPLLTEDHVENLVQIIPQLNLIVCDISAFVGLYLALIENENLKILIHSQQKNSTGNVTSYLNGPLSNLASRVLKHEDLAKIELLQYLIDTPTIEFYPISCWLNILHDEGFENNSEIEESISNLADVFEFDF
ncbi:hypothetical protein GEMRC1_004881 [Eukaryota sp. GEM-RC1]